MKHQEEETAGCGKSPHVEIGNVEKFPREAMNLVNFYLW